MMMIAYWLLQVSLDKPLRFKLHVSHEALLHWSQNICLALLLHKALPHGRRRWLFTALGEGCLARNPRVSSRQKESRVCSWGQLISTTRFRGLCGFSSIPVTLRIFWPSFLVLALWRTTECFFFSATWENQTGWPSSVKLNLDSPWIHLLRGWLETSETSSAAAWDDDRVLVFLGECVYKRPMTCPESMNPLFRASYILGSVTFTSKKTNSNESW